MFCSELAACALGSIGTLKLAGFDGTPVDEGDEARSFLPEDFADDESAGYYSFSLTYISHESGQVSRALV